MTKHMNFVTGCAIAGLLVFATMESTAAQSIVDESQNVALTLACERTSYHVGEPIVISIRLKNNSAETMRVEAYAPWDAVDLRIERLPTLALISTVHGPNGFKWRFSAPVKVMGGESYAYSWADVNRSPRLLTSYPISFWGYENLAPGEYQITAIPRDVVFRVGDNAYSANRHPSNTVHVTITN
jgi:hypothetical protein